MATNKIQIFLLCPEKQFWKDFLWPASSIFQISSTKLCERLSQVKKFKESKSKRSATVILQIHQLRVHRNRLNLPSASSIRLEKPRFVYFIHLNKCFLLQAAAARNKLAEVPAGERKPHKSCP